MSTPTDILSRDRARDWAINTGSVGSPTWTPIGGINKWSPSPKKNSTDTTKFSDDGWLSHLAASRGNSFTLSGLVQMDADDEVRDPGQDAVNALGQLMGADSRGQFQITGPGGGTLVFTATVNVTDGGGGNDDADPWSVELEVSGPLVYTPPA